MISTVCGIDRGIGARPVAPRLGALGALLLCAACTPARSVMPAPSGTSCIVADDSARSRITFAVTDETMHGPVQMYESLLRLDCMETLRGAIAHEWSSDDRLNWRFTISPDRHFHDGTPVTARSIAQAWSAQVVPGVPVVPFFAQVDAAAAYDLRLTLHTPADARVFADPALLVARHPRVGWPVGTGPYTGEFDTALRLLRLFRREPSETAPDTIDVRRYGADLRSAIDAGADLLVTDDAATIAYARARTDYALAPLPWNRTYVLLTPGGGTGAVPPADALEALARDAVSADARPAEPPYWWSACDGDELTREAVSGRHDILYTRGDDTARELAERIAALLWPAARAPAWLSALLPPEYPAPRAIAVNDNELVQGRRTALAVVAPLPHVSAPACADERPDIPMQHVGWHWTITPLVTSREYLIHRSGIGRVTVDGHGIIRFGER